MISQISLLILLIQRLYTKYFKKYKDIDESSFYPNSFMNSKRQIKEWFAALPRLVRLLNTLCAYFIAASTKIVRRKYAESTQKLPFRCASGLGSVQLSVWECSIKCVNVYFSVVFLPGLFARRPLGIKLKTLGDS